MRALIQKIERSQLVLMARNYRFSVQITATQLNIPLHAHGFGFLYTDAVEKIEKETIHRLVQYNLLSMFILPLDESGPLILRWVVGSQKCTVVQMSAHVQSSQEVWQLSFYVFIVMREYKNINF